MKETGMKTILIVDDLPMMRTVIKNIISQLNITCECIEAEDGLDALRCLARTKVDVVLLDWIMPNISGLDFLKKVRTLKVDIPIIMITGESDTASVKEAMKAGINGYIVKPVTKEVLSEKLFQLNITGGEEE
jgi:two-component system chemotaxis response regulator CheY